MNYSPTHFNISEIRIDFIGDRKNNNVQLTHIPSGFCVGLCCPNIEYFQLEKMLFEKLDSLLLCNGVLRTRKKKVDGWSL